MSESRFHIQVGTDGKTWQQYGGTLMDLDEAREASKTVPWSRVRIVETKITTTREVIEVSR